MDTNKIEWEDGKVLSQTQIADFENKLGVNLPTDYKEVIKNHDG